jgi:hypothetical protein
MSNWKMVVASESPDFYGKLGPETVIDVRIIQGETLSEAMKNDQNTNTYPDAKFIGVYQA